MRSVIFTMMLFLPIAIWGQAKPANELVAEANNFYRKGQYAKAEEMYRKAIAAEPEHTTAKLNLAASLYRQDKQVEAAQLYAELANKITDKKMLATTWYNKGVILSRQKNLEESIEVYKNALRNNPEDKEARENLQKALLELKKKAPPKNKKEDQQKKKPEQQPRQKQSKMKPGEAEQRLKLLRQKEKEVQQRVQKEKTKSGGSQTKDW